MANIFLQLPTTAANAAGTPIDVSLMGANKTVVVAGSWRLTPNITIEFNNDPALVAPWAPLQTFQGGGFLVQDVACMYMRAVVSNFKGGQAPEVWVGSDDEGTDFTVLTAPAGNGAGAAVSVATKGIFKTVQVAGTFRGETLIEISEDGGTTWAQMAAFQSPGYISTLLTADFMRVRRGGVPTISPGLPIINVGDCIAVGGGGGGGGGGNEMRFSYTVTGAEPALDALVIPLPALRATALYQVMVQMATDNGGFQYTSNIDESSRTVAQFVLTLSSVAVAGDVFWFTVADPT